MIPFIDELVSLSLRCRMLGLHGFFDFLEECTDAFEITAVEMVINGFSPDMIFETLTNYISASTLSDKTYLEYLIFPTFVVFAHEGSFPIPAGMETLLRPFLGIDFMEDLAKRRYWGDLDDKTISPQFLSLFQDKTNNMDWKKRRERP